MSFRIAIVLVMTLRLFAGPNARSSLSAPGSTPTRALRDKNYDQAIAGFEQAITVLPRTAPPSARNLAYTLLKSEKTKRARDQFGEAMRLDPADQHVALEYAFLCYETKQQAEARRIFDRIRKTGDARPRTPPNRPFRISTSRSPRASHAGKRRSKSTPTISARIRNLPRWPNSAINSIWPLNTMRKPGSLNPPSVRLMLDLGRVWKLLGRNEDANAILLAASRGGQPRVAEQARELLPDRYPYVYEFEKALELDPENFELRREYAYLLLAMGKQDDAEREFQTLHQTDAKRSADLRPARIPAPESERFRRRAAAARSSAERR